MGKVYGYARVSSTKEQNLDRQLVALAGRGVDADLVFTDKATGASFGRPGYGRLVKTLRKGDLLVVTSVDTLIECYLFLVGYRVASVHLRPAGERLCQVCAKKVSGPYTGSGNGFS